MAHVTRPELKRIIEENYQNVTVLLTDVMGYAGPYAGMGIDREQAKAFKQKLIDYHVDAVICGNGGCGICTPKETGSAIAAEYLGIPAVVVAGLGFTDQAKYTAYNNGIAVLRTAECPGAFATHTEQQLIDKTRNVTWPQILAGLTTPITQAEIDAAKNADHGDLRDDVFWGDIHKIDSFFVSMQWSDGLPFVPPTYEEANRYLEYCDYAWHETVVVMPGGAHSIAAVEVPTKWDSIMASKGYLSLESMYLPDSGGTTTAAPVVSANGSPVSFNGREIVNSEHKKIAIYDASGKMVGRSNTHFSIPFLPASIWSMSPATKASPAK